MSPTPPTLETERWLPVPSARMALRKYVVASLRDRTLVGCRVYDARSTPPRDDDESSIFVHCKDERAELFQDTPRAYVRTLQCWIDIYERATEGDENPADLVDAIAAQVEAIMHLVEHEITQAQLADALDDPLTWSLHRGRSGYQGTSMDQDDEGHQLEAGARITWNLTYVTEVGEDQLLADKITPFDRATVAWDLDADGEIDATDAIHLEQP